MKSVEKLLTIHKVQLMSYLNLSGCKVGLLINFSVELLKDGIQRIVSNFPDSAYSAYSALKNNDAE
ncbi:MAG: GxxExxY protein [Candidatus Eremiobacteraeota bacterium]|nr:GxxExxY protein [Candidatus Eremiobacteraeota bacterium]